jgi:hypothetical protein
MSILAILFWLLATPAHANLAQTSTATPPVAPSCNAIITGSGADGNAILTGSATALGNLTCQ